MDPRHADLSESLFGNYPRGFVVRGCSARFTSHLLESGGERLSLGFSADIDLTAFHPSSSLRQLYRRGARTLRVMESRGPQAIYSLVAQLKIKARCAPGPFLKHLFREKAESGERCLGAFEKTAARGPVAAVTLSRISCSGWHAEWMLRDRSAPAGTMEYLIGSIIKILTREGSTHLNLGEVPFITPERAGLPGLSHPPADSRKRRLCLFAASRFLRPVYDFHALFRFKNKFAPRWEPVYWYGWPDLSLLDLMKVALRTKTLALMWRSAWR